MSRGYKGFSAEHHYDMRVRVLADLEATRAELATLRARNAELEKALEGLFRECVMIHKYGGDKCNQREADAAIANAWALLQHHAADADARGAADNGKGMDPTPREYVPVAVRRAATAAEAQTVMDRANAKAPAYLADDEPYDTGVM